MTDARAVPFYCPFCGEEDLYPTTTRRDGGIELDEQARRGGGPESQMRHEDTHGAWHCRSCTRVFTLKLVGLVTTR
jgi:hypothetical protein